MAQGNQINKIFEVNSDNFKNFLDVVQTVIDFYWLFEKSINFIIEVWQSKLTHVQNLYDTLDIQHKTKFNTWIWLDETIKEVIVTF